MTKRVKFRGFVYHEQGFCVARTEICVVFIESEEGNDGNKMSEREWRVNDVNKMKEG